MANVIPYYEITIKDDNIISSVINRICAYPDFFEGIEWKNYGNMLYMKIRERYQYKDIDRFIDLLLERSC